MKGTSISLGKPNIFLILFTFIKAVIIILLEAASIYFINYLVSGNFKMFLIFGISILIGYFIQLILSYYFDIYQLKIIEKNIVKLNLNLIKKITRQKPKYLFDGEKYVSWFINDVNSIRNLYFNSYYSVLYNVFIAIIGFILLIKIHYLLACLSIVITSLTIFIPKLYINKVNDSDYKLTKNNENFNKKVSNLIDGFKLLYFNNNEKNINKPVEIEINRLTNSRIKNKKTHAKYSSIIFCVRILNNVIIYSLTVVLIFFKYIKIGILLSISQIIQHISGGITGSIKNYTNIKSAKKILQKFENEIVEYNGENKISICEINNIEFKNVSVDFDGNIVLDNFSANFVKGKKYAIIGESGSGKSTLIKLILGVVDDYKGKILVNGINIENINKFSLFENLSYANSENFIFGATIKENISLNLEYRENNIYEIIDKLNLNEINDDIELSKDGISTGQIQRINLARLFLYKKDFVILDEATSNLDIENRIIVENKILNTKDSTVIVITHHLTNALKNKFDFIIDFSKI